MQLKFQDDHLPKYALEDSLSKLQSKYDKELISKHKIARSILVPTSDSISVTNTFKQLDKSFNVDERSRIINQSKVSSSMERKQSKAKKKEKQEEVSYYKILFEGLQAQNQRLKQLNNKMRTSRPAKPKAAYMKRSSMDINQIQYLAEQIQNIQKRFSEDQTPKYQKFYKKFVAQFKNIGLKMPRSPAEAWEGWQLVKRKMESSQGL